MKTPVLMAVLGMILFPSLSRAQQTSPTQRAATDATIGTVVSSQRGVLVVRTDDGRYVVFALDRDTVRPRTIASGARVSVESTTEDEAGGGARTAISVTLSGIQPSTPPPASTQDVIPASVRRLEREIARNVRRYRAGIRAGVALDPEIISLGAHATLGPIFSRRLLFRPNVEFAYGEVTTLFAVNLEGIYRLSQTMPRNQWSPYVGGGPTLGFSHRGFSTAASDGRSFDFGDFSFNGGVNLLAGFEKPSGVFIELKTTVYTDPHLRLLFGVTF